MYLVMDCETTGLPKNWKAPVSDLGNWPRVIQIAWSLYDTAARHLESAVRLIKPDGFVIPLDAQRIHRITTARAEAEGMKLNIALAELTSAVNRCEIIVGHNVRFDENVISAEYLRLGLEPPFENKKRFCTMMETASICKLPGTHGYKWPTLSELHLALFKSHYEEAHDAWADVAACAKCFFELRRRGVFPF